MSKAEKMRSKLEEIYHQKPLEFERLLPIRGMRNRIIIAESRKEVDESGQSMNPKEICGPDGRSLWVCANWSAPQLSAFTFWVMDKLGYPKEDLVKFMKDFLKDVYMSNE